MSGMAWMADEPVPITPTRLPVKETRSCGQLPVCSIRPPNDSRPLNFGTFADDRQPVAMMQNFADTRSPVAVSILQRPADSSKTADFTRVFIWMSPRRSKRSTTWLMYARISGCEA